jgi:multidrug efflux pump subunit AcrB
VRFVPRSEEAAELGVSTEDLSEVIRIATIGDIDANLAKFNADNRQIPIRVQLAEAARANRQVLETLKVRTASGQAVPLVSVASIEVGQGPSSIERYDRQRQVKLGADLVGTDALGVALEKVFQCSSGRYDLATYAGTEIGVQGTEIGSRTGEVPTFEVNRIEVLASR